MHSIHREQHIQVHFPQRLKCVLMFTHSPDFVAGNHQKLESCVCALAAHPAQIVGWSENGKQHDLWNEVQASL